MILNGVLLTLGLLFMSILLLRYLEKIHIIKLIVITVFCFVCMYIVVSAIFFWFDCFKVTHVQIAVVILLMAINIIYKKKENKVGVIMWECNLYLIPILISFFMVFLVSEKFEFFGMGQDQGVYQTKTIELLNGDTKKQKDFKEYSKINDAAEQQEYSEKITNILLGFDRYDSRWTTLNEEDKMSEVSGIYHGIPTFPALMAVWATIFGFSNMQGIQTVFLILTIFFLFFILENLNVGRKNILSGMILFCLVPITIWISKSALTEMFLTVIMVAFIFSLIEKDKKIWPLSLVAVAAFCFYHVSIYTILPVLVLSYWFFYYTSKKRQYIYYSIISVILYIIGFCFMASVSPQYTFNNYGSLYRVCPIINANNLVVAVLLVGGITIFIACIFPAIAQKNHIIRISEGVRNWSFRIVLVFSLISIFIIAWRLTGKYYNILNGMRHVTLMAYCMLTGLMWPCFLFLIMLIKPTIFLRNKNQQFVVLLFLYCVVFHSIALRSDMPHYYYYSRYVLPFIPIIIILGCLALEGINWRIKYIVPILSILILLPFDRVLFTGLDDTRMKWNILEDITEIIETPSAVIIEDVYMTTLFIPVKEITGADVYPSSSYMKKQESELQEAYNKVYYIGEKARLDEKYHAIVYKNRFYESQDIGLNGKLLPFPTEFTKQSRNIMVYELGSERKTYSFENADFEYTGFDAIEGTFAWMNQETASIRCNLKKGNYKLEIHLGTGIPLTRLNKTELRGELLVNGKSIAPIAINNETNEVVDVYISGETLSEGWNLISIRTELWSPNDYGDNDMRKLGIPVKALIFNSADSE